MSRRIATLVALSVIGALALAPQAFAGSYSSRISQYVAARPAQARIVQSALVRAGWAYNTPSQKALVRQAILVSAGESGMNPVNNGNPSCSGLFQILNGKRTYGVWTAAEVANTRVRAHYTLSESPWRFGTVKTYATGRYLGVADGWYKLPGTSGNRAADWKYGKVKTYATARPTGYAKGWYRAPAVTYYTPRVGEYKIFNPVFNAEVARRMFASRGWRPWTVARKLGF